ANAREDIVTQLESRPYEVSVLPRYEELGAKKSGRAQTAVAIPLADEPGPAFGRVKYRAETDKSGQIGSRDTPMPRGDTNPTIPGSPTPQKKRFWRGHELDLGTPASGEAGKYKRESAVS